MEVHYWALAELFLFAFAVYFAKAWIDYWFGKSLQTRTGMELYTAVLTKFEIKYTVKEIEE